MTNKKQLQVNIAKVSSKDLTHIHLPLISQYISSLEYLVELQYNLMRNLPVDPDMAKPVCDAFIEMEVIRKKFYGGGNV